MSIQKQYLKSKPYCKVTFLLSKQHVGKGRNVAVAGEFNEWKTDQTPLKAKKNGDFATTLTLQSGREYQYRFVVDGEEWITDDSADKYVNSGVDKSKNAVVVV
jgi:1,4-alpha-glucan branching enzyme